MTRKHATTEEALRWSAIYDKAKNEVRQEVEAGIYTKALMAQLMLFHNKETQEEAILAEAKYRALQTLRAYKRN